MKKLDHRKPPKMAATAREREKLLELSRLGTALQSGRISRRGFISAALALGVSLTAASSLINTVEAATPKQGGRFRQGVTGGATSDVLDPGQILDYYMISVLFGQCRNNLTEVDANGQLIAELAESWEASPDARTWHFKIRQGVEFHNGKTLDSQDVLDSLNHHLGEDSTSAAKGILDGVVSVKKDGKHAVSVELSGGDADFPFILSDYHLNICPSNSDGTISWQDANGTGGYVMKEHEPGVRTLTTRFPNYWKSGRAWFDEVETLQIPDVSARTSALRTGDLDAMINVDLKTVSRLKKIEGIVVGVTTGNKQITLPMRTDTAPFDNNDLRTAIKYSVDREQWLKKVLYGYGELGNDNPIGPANRYRATTEELPQRPYDPDKAKHYLKKAGYDNITVDFSASETGFAGALDAAQLMRETAKASGININIIREPNDGYWADVWMKKPWVACYWSGRPTENWMFSQVYAADASWNDTFWKNRHFNELLVLGRAELDPEKRRVIYVEMQRILHEDGGLCLPLFQSDVHAHTDKVGKPDKIAANWELDGAKACERWWFL